MPVVTLNHPEHGRLCLGRNPSSPEQIRRRLSLAKYLAVLPEPPEKCDWTANITDWLMLLNDQLGDCGPAAMFHGLMSKLNCVATSTADVPEIEAADKDVERFYYSVTGGRDDGVNNSDMLSYAQKHGMVIGGKTYKPGPYASVPAQDHATIKKAIYYLGGCLVGCNLPQSWFDNFGPGKTWDKTRSGSVGGHDIWAYAYDADGFNIVTWGQGGTLVTWGGAEQNCDEIDGIAQQDAWIGPTGKTPQGIKLQQWLDDVKALTG